MARITSFAMVLIATTSLLGWTACSEETTPTPDNITNDVPGTDIPGTDIPGTDVPADDVARPDVPVTDVPVTEVPVTDVPVTEVPVTDVPVTEVPVTDVPVTEVPVTDVPVTEVPVTDVPVTDVPATDVPPTDGVVTDVPPTDGVITDVPPTDGVVTDGITTDGIIPDGTPTEVIVTDVPPTDVTCTPNCDGRNCGSDGCGGDCGECVTGTTFCEAATGTCVPVCTWETDKPTSWGPAGVISALQTPAEKAVVEATCFDYTNDAKGDNGLKGLASQVNGPLADAIEGGDIGIVFELAGVTDFSSTAEFQLNGLLTTSTQDPPVLEGDFYVQEGSYIPETCRPMIYFKGAKIEGGKLTTPKSEFRLSIPVQEGLVIDATLIQAQIKGDIVAGGSLNGFELENGVLSGVLTKQQLKAAVDKLKETCATTTPKPDFCSYLTVVDSAMGLLFDLHQVGDGTFIPKSKDNPGDAASVCLAYSLSKAKIVGFEPTTAP